MTADPDRSPLVEHGHGSCMIAIPERLKVE